MGDKQTERPRFHLNVRLNSVLDFNGFICRYVYAHESPEREGHHDCDGED